MGNADDTRFFHGGVPHQSDFQIDGADPLAAGLHQILRAVDDFDVAVFVYGGGIAGAEPAVVRPPLGSVGGLLVAGRDPWAANFDSARGDPVPGCLPFWP